VGSCQSLHVTPEQDLDPGATLRPVQESVKNFKGANKIYVLMRVVVKQNGIY